MARDILRDQMVHYSTGKKVGSPAPHPHALLAAVDRYLHYRPGTPQAIAALTVIVGEIPLRRLPREVAR